MARILRLTPIVPSAEAATTRRAPEREIFLPCSRPGCDGRASVLLHGDTPEEAARGCLCSPCGLDAMRWPRILGVR